MEKRTKKKFDYVKTEVDTEVFVATYNGEDHEFSTEEDCLKFEKFLETFKLVEVKNENLYRGDPAYDIYTEVPISQAMYYLRLIDKKFTWIYIDEYLCDDNSTGWHRLYRRDMVVSYDDYNETQVQNVVDTIENIKKEATNILDSLKHIEDGKQNEL